MKGAAEGGTPVLDYHVSIAADGGSYTVLASGLTSLSYVASGLTAGVIYSFKVQSRNAYKYSDYSE